MSKRIVIAGVAIVAVLGSVGGTVAALGGGSSAPATHVSTSATTAPQPVTAAVTSATTAPPTTSAPPAPSSTTPTTTAPAPKGAQTTTTTLAPAIGAPGGSRFGPTGSPTP